MIFHSFFNESVEKSIRSCTVVLYNVSEYTSNNDFSVANDILEVLDPSLVVMPDVTRIGTSKSNKKCCNQKMLTWPDCV
jgi:hypothetical protein